jgi:hypothetical protein
LLATGIFSYPFSFLTSYKVEVIHAMTVALKYYHHTSLIILVHDAGSCFFPGYDEQPPHLSPVFSEKAITYLSCKKISSFF